MAITLEEARVRVGNGVVYRKPWMTRTEQGEITGVGDRYVFVRYQGDMGSKATAPEDLDWMAPS